MLKYFSLLLGGAALLLTTPLTSLAQEEMGEEEPEFHYLTVTTFDAPSGEEGQKVGEWIERVIAPSARMNPNVLSFRAAQHNWGSNSAQVAFISEYPNWAAIEADCEACDAWFEENVPEEGTLEREEWDEMAQAFFRAFNGHHDEIYAVNMNNAK
ncbi:MAG: hypothetical protein ACE5JR_10970 [Gemmatimonadota bacterium]